MMLTDKESDITAFYFMIFESFREKIAQLLDLTIPQMDYMIVATNINIDGLRCHSSVGDSSLRHSLSFLISNSTVL